MSVTQLGPSRVECLLEQLDCLLDFARLQVGNTQIIHRPERGRVKGALFGSHGVEYLHLQLDRAVKL
jgi:hypothetical protein